MTSDDRLVGDWRLVSWESVDDAGDVTRPFGEHPVGILAYTPTGTMITTIARDARPMLSSRDPLVGGPPEERLGAAQTFVAYSGGYWFDGRDVVHDVEMSLFPNWVGTRQLRHVELPDERTLVLSTDPFMLGGRRAIHRLTWRRHG